MLVRCSRGPGGGKGGHSLCWTACCLPACVLDPAAAVRFSADSVVERVWGSWLVESREREVAGARRQALASVTSILQAPQGAASPSLPHD